eukprot:5521597-Alexandrium_andersonii.AAC.1
MGGEAGRHSVLRLTCIPAGRSYTTTPHMTCAVLCGCAKAATPLCRAKATHRFAEQSSEHARTCTHPGLKRG